MKKTLLFLIFLFITNLVFSQVDTIVKTDIYVSYYSFKLKNPIMVTYNLHKGGGDCNRDHYHFSGSIKQKTATINDYSHSGYDMGHLANAEDFAYNCLLDSITFKFWNCVPQTPQLNRGIWRTAEDDIRSLSQNDSLLILCGSFFGNETIGKNKVFVPDTCWKIVYSHTKKQIINCLIFTNTSTPEVKQIEFKDLNKLVYSKYKININKIIKK